jgi:hypothetical protein
VKNTPARSNRTPTRAPASLYLVVGLLAGFGLLMVVRLVIGLLSSLLTIAVLVALVVVIVKVAGRRGSH